MNERISKYAQVTLESCAYAGTGNVLKVQQLLAQAGEHIELKEDESWKVTLLPWHTCRLSAARCITRLLVKLMLKGVAFPFRFFSILTARQPQSDGLTFIIALCCPIEQLLSMAAWRVSNRV